MIFADTSFLYAGIVADDDLHEEAVRLRSQLGSRKITTSNHVLGEIWTLARSRQRHTEAVRILDAIESAARIEIRRIDRRLEGEALTWLRRHDERRYSFVDATSFALMRSLGITEALAFDGDFVAAGFVELRP